MSCPSRGTWIEIPHLYVVALYQLVVPLTGHVDRNAVRRLVQSRAGRSCPSRGTWIEILNLYAVFSGSEGRAPHGARG